MFTTFLLISLRIICYVIPVVFLISLFKPEKFNIRTNKNINGKYSQKKILYGHGRLMDSLFNDRNNRC